MSAALFFLWLCAAPAQAAPFFGMLDASMLVVRGTVERVTPYEAAKLQVFRLRVDRVLKGDVAMGETIDLAQEMLFPSTKPYFATGVETLILATPLPNYSSFRKALPEGTYWRWAERLDTAADVSGLVEPAWSEVAGRYLAVRDDPQASADFFAATLAGPNARLRTDALVAIETRREIPLLLDAARLTVLEPWFRDERQPVDGRAQVLVRLGRLGTPGIVDIAEALAAANGPLQGPAVDALVSLDRAPAAERLLTWSRGSDEALRLAAGRGLAKLGSPAALGRLGEMLELDRSSAVVLGIIQALGNVPSERVVMLLAGEFGKSEKGRINAAAESLGRQGSPEAIAALGSALENGSSDAQAASAFALKRMNKHDAEEILHQQEANHPDPKVRKLCGLALGESMHEH